MGFHVCEYCLKKDKKTSSGTVYLNFGPGNHYMILHYVKDHGYRPPVEFIEDVTNGRLIDSKRAQSKSISMPVGFLEGEFEKGEVPAGFIEKLEELMVGAELAGNRVQYRSTIHS
jgi:hypothetical protein